jgi:hypothetical protein
MATTVKRPDKDRHCLPVDVVDYDGNFALLGVHVLLADLGPLSPHAQQLYTVNDKALSWPKECAPGLLGRPRNRCYPHAMAQGAARGRVRQSFLIPPDIMAEPYPGRWRATEA